jgi:hypothetical protein
VASPIVEVVPLRRLPNGTIQILLLARELDDPVWPGQLHIPGTVIRASDTAGSFDGPLQRVLSKELTGVQVTKPVFVQSTLHHSGRGMEASQIFWVEVQSDQPAVGTFYDTDHLPASLIKSQLDFIPDVVTQFKKYQS